jgi:hypothetical protein
MPRIEESGHGLDFPSYNGFSHRIHGLHAGHHEPCLSRRQIYQESGGAEKYRLIL